MSRRPVLALALALLLTLSACQGPEAEVPSPSAGPTPTASPEPYVAPQEFTLGCSAAGSLHPLRASDQDSLDVDSLVYEGLFRLDGGFEPQPVLAKSAAAGADGLTWTVRLRDGAVFSDGTAVTAQHVAACLLAAKTSARYASRLAGVSGVTAGAGAVTLTLTAPNGALPALLDIPIFLEREGALPLGTGPYAFSGDGDGLRFNRSWWKGKTPPYETIALIRYASPEDRAAAFGSGEVVALTCDFNAAGALGYSGTYETHDYPTSVMLYVGFNARQGGVCADAAVRAALSRVMDREGIVSTLLAGHGAAAALPVSPSSPLYSQDVARRLDYDPDGAAAALEGAGWKKDGDGRLARYGRTMFLKLCVNRDSTVKRAAAAQIAQALEELGITVTVETLDWEAYAAALTAGAFDLYLGEVKLTHDFDFTPLAAGALDYGGYTGGNLRPALDAFRGSAGMARQRTASTLYGAFAAEAPFAVLCFKNYSLLARWGMVGSLSPLPDAPFAGIENWSVSP